MSYDAIVIGAGHNGLTAAAVLAASGRKVLVLESGDEIGGGLRSHEFHPGFRAPSVAHLLGQVHPAVIAALGLKLDLTPLPTVVLAAAAEPAILRGGWGADLQNVAPDQAAKWAELRKLLFTQANILKPFLARRAPALGNFSLGDKAFMAKTAIGLRLKGRDTLDDFLRMLLICVADVAEEFLTDDRLQALVSFDAVLGYRLGPRSPGSLLGLLYRLTGEVNGQQAVLAGGDMGRVVSAFEAAARKAGAEIRTAARVGRVLVEDRRACGVVLEDGSEFRASSILSATSPRTTMLGLVGARHLDAGLVQALAHLPAKGNVAKLHLALDKMPDFGGQTSGRFVVADGLNQIERAFNPSKYHHLPDEPVFEFVLGTEAPRGAAVLSAAIPFAAHDLKEGWDKGRAILTKAVLTRLEKLSPGIGKTVLHAELLAPPDLEARFGLAGGHWHHVDMSADRMLMLRPLHELAGYGSTLPGLTLCGAGTHPGGGISGISGLNAAKTIIAGGRS